jgi:hypothetical protein
MFTMMAEQEYSDFGFFLDAVRQGLMRWGYAFKYEASDSIGLGCSSRPFRFKGWSRTFWKCLKRQHQAKLQPILCLHVGSHPVDN